MWVWAVIDASSKLVPVMKMGPRTLELAYGVVHDLCQILQPGCVPIFSSDGLKLYFYTFVHPLVLLDRAFWVYGAKVRMAKNQYGRSRLLSCMPS